MEYIRKSLIDIKKQGDRELLLAVLWDLGKYNEKTVDYNATLDPENIEYDNRGNSYIKAESIEDETNSDFIIMYKAAIGALLQDRYKYVDYIEGGQSLLRKEAFLATIFEANSIEDIRKILMEEHEKCISERKRTKKLINKRLYVVGCIGLVIISLAAITFGTYFFRNYFFVGKRNNAYIAGYESYLSKDYIKVIDDLSAVDSKYMDYKEKYILAISYIRTENLTDEQKENIINDLNVLNLEKLFDYWIFLGRGEYETSQNMAMQLSDDELLLYSYMKEREYLKNNTSVEGQEKADRLAELERNIESYKKDFEQNVSSDNVIDMH